MKRIELDLTRFGLTCTQSRFEQYQDLQNPAGYLVNQLTALFASEPQDAQRVEWPATWWQHFKQRFFPAWLRAKFPVRMERREFTVKTLYPFLKTNLPLKVVGPRVMILVNDIPAGVFMADLDGAVPSQWPQEVSKAQQARSFAGLNADAKKCPCCRRAWFEFYI